MFETLKQAFKVKEIRVKIWYTLLFLLIYRIGCYIPVPGIGNSLIESTDLESLSYLNVMNMMTGGSLASGTLFAMGIGPYINSSIIIQLLAVAIPALERLSKQGEEGRKKIASITRYVTVGLGLITAFGYYQLMKANGILTDTGIVTDEVTYMPADMEDDFIVAQANEPLDENGCLANERITCRHRNYLRFSETNG